MADEFVNTNRKGSYSSYDLVKGITRKYHGLLVASSINFQRSVVVSSLIEKLILAEQVHDFSGNYYLNSEQPGIFKYIEHAYFMPYPTQIFKIASARIKKQLELQEQGNKINIHYEINTPEAAKLSLEPVLTLRDFHKLGLPFALDSLQLRENNSGYELQLSPEIQLKLTSPVATPAKLRLSPNHFYPIEQERGYEAYEDLIATGEINLDLKPGINKINLEFELREKLKSRKIFVVAKEALTPSNNNSIISDISRFKTVHPQIPASFSEYLVYNARKFIVKGPTRYSLLAGYHWFGEWSRDTFISFKGIMLGLGRYHEAQKLLIDWGKYISVGLLPNTMEGLHYNSLDGILWYFQALWYYWEATQDKETVLHLLPKLERVVYAFTRGSKYGIQIDSKGYLMWTDETKALTWMDAIVDAKPVVQRAGAAVEIQALWYSSLQILEKLANLCNYKLINLAIIDELERLLESNFHAEFWLPEQNYYADYISNASDKGAELRPNQLALYALPFNLGKQEFASAVLTQVETKLLTKVGLKTLSADFPGFKAEYKGNQYERDLAYHQGSVWVWPLLLYYNAVIKYQAEGKAKVSQHLLGAWEELARQKLLHIPELFSATNLVPGGTIAQAWSVAALIEGTMNITN